MTLNSAPAWRIAGLYFEACNCALVCPCYSTQPPTYGFCEGNCAWHVQHGHFGATALDGLNVIMVQRCDGFMRETHWQCWFYIDDRATPEQFDALTGIFSLRVGGHLAKTFSKLWEVRRVEPAAIAMKLDGWQHRATVLGRLGLAVGLLKPEAGPTLCRVPNTPGVAALAEEDWFDDGAMQFDHRGKNALTTTFAYHSDQ
ncbi:MAG: DUF1326 domain-containing protein [Anaerolineales bacterium]|nr:DUF1326 domain-containing protein [Anaerolineales bacterium]